MPDTPVLVLLDHHDLPGAPLRAGVADVLAAAHALAAGAPVHGVWAGDATQVPLAELGRAGVSQVHVLTADADLRLTAPLAEAVRQVVADTGTELVLATSTFANKEVAARLGLAIDAGVVTDATGLERVDGRLLVTKTVFAGTWTTRVEVTVPRAVVTVKAGSAVATPVADPVVPQVTEEVVQVSDRARQVQLVERTERAVGGRPDLAAAQVVVVGGRGTEGDFSAVEELADVLGAAVGATRVATDEGWIGREAQIGQTGVTVSPRLYIGAGVSGAVHHRGGMQASGTIVAVNSDPEAPIFEIADLGIVGDLFSVLPQAAAELRRLRG